MSGLKRRRAKGCRVFRFIDKMKYRHSFWNCFQTKVTLAFIFSLMLLVVAANFLLYQYTLKSRFNQIRNNLSLIVRNAALAVDAEELLKVPLNREGMKSLEYKAIAERLKKIKEANPSLKYIYTMVKSQQPEIWQFVVDPDPVVSKKNQRALTAFPGDKYDVSRFPEMIAGLSGPSTDKELTADEWGVTLSGYAPIYNNEGKAVAILGIDINANEIYDMQKAVGVRALFVLFMALITSVLLGIWVSRAVTRPVEKLVDGTRKIASGDWEYKVDIESKDEIGELADSFNDMASSLADAKKKLRDYFYRVVQAMVRSLEAKDPYTGGHSDRVSEYAQAIALELGITAEKAELLRETAQLHDIGKLGIHEDVLNKKAALSENEWGLIHKHPALGEEILKPVFIDEEMLPVIRSHHEHYDGSGYPDHLKGDQINIYAQIVSVADSYDAMTSSRAYRPALSKSEAISRLKQASGTQFNPKIIEAFIRILQRQG